MVKRARTVLDRQGLVRRWLQVPNLEELFDLHGIKAEGGQQKEALRTEEPFTGDIRYTNKELKAAMGTRTRPRRAPSHVRLLSRRLSSRTHPPGRLKGDRNVLKNLRIVSAKLLIWTFVSKVASSTAFWAAG